MNSVMSALQNTVSISLFNRGFAGKIFSDVRRTGAKVVMKNNIPECVLLSPEEYTELIEQLEDAKLLSLAEERMANYDPNTVITSEEMDKIFNITSKDLDGFEEVEFE